MAGDSGWPFVVTLGFDPETFGRLDALRRRFFPPERNVVPAHLSLFHHLPPGEGAAIARSLDAAASHGPIPLAFPGLKRLGGGMAVTVEAPGLKALHGRLSAAFGPWLTPQDRQPLRPHVTLMNKADKAAAALAFESLRASWERWAGTGTDLLLWSYRGGPWAFVAAYPLRGDSGTTATGSA